MGYTFTTVFKFVVPDVNQTDWGTRVNEELIGAQEMVLAQVAKGNGILAPAASGDILSAGTGATQITAAAHKVVINETLREVAVQTDQALTDDDLNYIYDDSTGTFTISTTAPTGEFCLLGVVLCESGARTYIANSAIRASTRIVMTNAAFFFLNADLGTDGTAADGGIKVERGTTGADAVIQWNETDDVWEAGVVGTVYQIALLKGASNTLRHEEGGLEADISAYAAVPIIRAGATGQWTFDHQSYAPANTTFTDCRIQCGLTKLIFAGTASVATTAVTFPTAVNAHKATLLTINSQSGLTAAQYNGLTIKADSVGTTGFTAYAQTGDGTNPDADDYVYCFWITIGTLS